MGRTKQDHLIAARTPVRRAMPLALWPRVRKLLDYEDLVRQGDVDAVHDMRVATKRLREATRLFRPALGKARLARHVDSLEALNDALGGVRELDVLGMRIEALCSTGPEVRQALAPLTQGVQVRAQIAREQLHDVLAQSLPRLRPDFRALLSRKNQRKSRAWGVRFADFGASAVRRRLVRAFAMEQAARVPEAVSEFHAMRIAVKKLRYGLELFLHVLGRPARRAYGPVGELQDLMGEVHDWDVVLAEITATCALPASPHTTVALELAARERARLYAMALAHLDKMHRKGLAADLLASLR
jgi:CHAD domain-containing protein